LPLDIFMPCIALVSLTSLIWAMTVYLRIQEMRVNKIPPQFLATSCEVSSLLRNSQASDNFSNLFELPVLFFILCLALEVTHSTTFWYVIAAWAFVFLRVFHSLIQVTSNRVTHRFAAWLLSSICLFWMWGNFAADRICTAH
jgi:hypothetical protein